MTFEEILDQALAMLQRRGGVTYRTLQRQFNLDDAALEDLKEALLYAHPHVADDPGQGLRWRGETTSTPPPGPAALQPDPRLAAEDLHSTPAEPSPRGPHTPDAERRQLTVLFCDLVDSTALASQLDPEDWREVVRAYQEACAKVIAQYDGHIAQYLGDGLLVYFGYPHAHEDDAQRAVQTSLDMLEAIRTLNTRLAQDKSLRLAVRIGIHTGLVVVGGMGAGGRNEPLALGDTPNVAARLQGLAAPDTVVISAATYRLVQGYFTAATLGPQTLKGLAAPVPVYCILGASAAQSRLDVAAATGLTPLVGRESDVALLLERWAQSQAGLGQVVLLSGEAGIGKSRLVEVLRHRAVSEGSPNLTLRCSPYHTHSALYPVIAHLQRVLAWRRDEPPAATLDRLECVLRASRLAPDEAVPLVAALLSVPLPEGRYPPVLLTPQQQRQQTLDGLVAWLLAEAERQPVLVVWEDLHWADPSTLELLGLVIDQAPTAHMLTLVTYRPEFRPPWAPRSHLTQLTLGRLPRAQVEIMVRQLTGDKPLPAEVLAQVVAKTDGVPLFVEELVKMILESGLVREEEDRYGLTGPLPSLAIPTTLQDSLMARLDRLSTARAVAQLGAVLGREFDYELMRAVATMEEATLQQGLAQLVDAELLYQRGRPPQARYLFKHALIQEAAYQSLLKSTRQRYHQRSAQVLEAQFPETAENQPELLAHHYTEASLLPQAIRYWHRAGERTSQRSAHVEAIAHLTTALALLMTLPETPDRAQQELDLQATLGPTLMVTKGFAAPEVVRAYARARELCQQVGDTARLFPVVWGLHRFYQARAELSTAHELGAQLLSLAHRTQDPVALMEAHRALGQTLLQIGELPSALEHLEQGIALYDPQHHRSVAFRYGADPKVICLCHAALALWRLGYPDRALERSHQALPLARDLGHPFSLANAQFWAAWVHQFRREQTAAHEQAEAAITLATAQGFPLAMAFGTLIRGWALAAQGQAAEGLGQIRQSLADWRATGGELHRPYFLALLAEACGRVGAIEEGLCALDEALTIVNTTTAHQWEAELYRLKGELLLQAIGKGDVYASPMELSRPAATGEANTGRSSLLIEAETCFRQALDVARCQQAKSLELRAAMSLARLWQQQGKQAEAHELLAPVYGWFTEGFDTADLQEAKTLLEALSH